MSIKKEYAIVSKDRHRDDYVYLFTGTLEEVREQCEKIWKQDFSFAYDYEWVSSGGSYTVEYTEVKKIS